MITDAFRPPSRHRPSPFHFTLMPPPSRLILFSPRLRFRRFAMPSMLLRRHANVTAFTPTPHYEALYLLLFLLLFRHGYFAAFAAMILDFTLIFRHALIFLILLRFFAASPLMISSLPRYFSFDTFVTFRHALLRVYAACHAPAIRALF